MTRVRVSLSREDVLDVRTYAAAIRDNRDRVGRQDRFNYGADVMLEKETLGRLGEFALATWLNVPYDFSLYGDNNGDVCGYEVRTRSRHHYDLPTYDTDRRAKYVLATCEEHHLIILHGWAHLDETTTQARWAGHLPYPCYLTRQVQLHPMATLVL